MNYIEKERCSRMTKVQKEFLINFLEQHKFLLVTESKIRPYQLEKYKQTWIQLAEELNKLSGSRKSVKDWKSSLGTFKELTRKKARLLHNDIKITGGGPKTAKELNHTEERLLNLLSPIVIAGVADLPEGGVIAEFEAPLEAPARAPAHLEMAAPALTVVEDFSMEITGDYVLEMENVNITNSPVPVLPVTPSFTHSQNMKEHLDREQPSMSASSSKTSRKLDKRQPSTLASLNKTPSQKKRIPRRHEPRFMSVARNHENVLRELAVSNYALAASNGQLAKAVSRKLKKKSPVFNLKF